MGYITDISIDETSLIMFLKYREKGKDKERYNWEIYETYDPFDKDSIYNQALKASKTLNKTALLIRPKFGTVVTRDILLAELKKFQDANETPLTTNDPTITEKKILLQFDTPEDADATRALFETYKATFLQGTCNSTIM